jgi:hypothetical protein
MVDIRKLDFSVSERASERRWEGAGGRGAFAPRDRWADQQLHAVARVLRPGGAVARKRPRRRELDLRPQRIYHTAAEGVGSRALVLRKAAGCTARR